MQIGFARAAFGLTFLGGSYLACVYQFELLRSLGLAGALLVVVLFLAPAVAAGIWLKKHRSPPVRALGSAMELVFEHGALMLGAVLTVIVYWGVVLATGDTAMPASRAEFLYDFLSSTAVLAAVIYTIALGMAAAFSGSVAVRVAAVATAVVVVAVPAVALTLGEGLLRGWAADRGGLFALGWVGLLALGSVVSWRLFVAREPRKDGGARRR